MKPVTETVLLLVLILASTIVSTAAWHWDGWQGSVATYCWAMVAGMACGRITRIVRRATA